jgi:hypothetical protein
LLALFYIVAVPLAGTQQAGAEGAYLIVNKTLIEGVAVAVLLAFRTGEVAGLDLLLAGWKQQRAAQTETARASAATVAQATRESFLSNGDKL